MRKHILAIILCLSAYQAGCFADENSPAALTKSAEIVTVVPGREATQRLADVKKIYVEQLGVG